jgi:hypothetical protein
VPGADASATNDKQQRPATADNARSIPANLGYVRHEKQTAACRIRDKRVARSLDEPEHDGPLHEDGSEW